MAPIDVTAETLRGKNGREIGATTATTPTGVPSVLFCATRAERWGEGYSERFNRTSVLLKLAKGPALGPLLIGFNRTSVLLKHVSEGRYLIMQVKLQPHNINIISGGSGGHKNR